MGDSLCILVHRPPYGGIQAAEAVRHLNGAATQGLEATAILLEDGMYVARAGQDAVLLPTQRLIDGGSLFDGVVGQGVRFLVLEDDLRLRGFGKDDLRQSAQLVTYRTAIRRMTQEGASVKGCF